MNNDQNRPSGDASQWEPPMRTDLELFFSIANDLAVAQREGDVAAAEEVAEELLDFWHLGGAEKPVVRRRCEQILSAYSPHAIRDYLCRRYAVDDEIE